MSVEGNGDGSDVFWPGYVDAVTNLVLNLLFLLTIMTVAVFIFAMEMGKQHKSTENAPVPVEGAQLTAKSEPAKVTDAEVEEMRKEIDVLKREVKLANDLRVPPKVLSATAGVAKPVKSIEQTTPVGGGIVVRYADDAVSLTAVEVEKLRVELGPVLVSGGARIDVVVPRGFSEAKRLGFYRAMAVRNLLIEMKLPAARIEVVVREGAVDSDASVVRLTPR